MNVIKRDGRTELFNHEKIQKQLERACYGLEDINKDDIIEDIIKQLYSGVTTKEIDSALTLSARSRIELEPNYSYVAARLLLYQIYKEVFGKIDLEDKHFDTIYRGRFISNIKELVEKKKYDPRLLDFDLLKLATLLKPERDYKFKYLGVQTLYDRYFIKSEAVCKETPQFFWMRVCMGLCLNEISKEYWVEKFYNMVSEFRACFSTPTLYNSGTLNKQLSSCFLTSVEDSADGIMGCYHSQSLLSKHAGGLGLDITNIRAAGSEIKSSGGKSSGVIPYIKIFNDILVSFDQAGKRLGSGCIYIEPWHLDIHSFLNLRKTVGDERLRAHDTNTAIWVPDLFMTYVEEDKDWYLFCPSECPDLHSSYGAKFKQLYEEYIVRAEQGKLIRYKKIRAKDLMKDIIRSVSETGHPFVTFKCSSNIRYTDKHCGVINSSNLCTEYLRHTIPSEYKRGTRIKLGEIAVCNLSSTNLVAHLNGLGHIDFDMLEETRRLQVRAADNVIDLNYYPVDEAAASNLKHRPIGLGLMGFQDGLHMRNIAYDSEEAVKISEYVHSYLSYVTIDESIALAITRGKYSTYEGSEWSKGKLPIDLYNEHRVQRGLEPEKLDIILDWKGLREKQLKYGIRNSSLMCIAPTASISYILGVSPSNEPDYSMLFVYSTLSGHFTCTNEYLVKRLKKENLWTPQLCSRIKEEDGDIAQIAEIPEEIRKQYKTAFSYDFKKLIECTAAAQKYIDMGISFNIYYNGSSLKEIYEIYNYCWKNLLKTTYYFRTRGASKIEKVTMMAPPKSPESNLCSIESKRRGEECLSCQ